MSFDGALIKEQGVTFAIVVVKPHVLSSTNKEAVRRSFSQYFGNVPTVLMAQDARGIPTYDGRKDKEAIMYGRKIAIHQQSELIIHDRQGRIRDKDSHGNDPCPPKDTRH